MSNTVKAPIGLRRAWWWPITEEPANSKPTYAAAVDMGSNVRSYLSLTTASGEIRGDDVTQVAVDVFVSGQLDVETNYSDLELNARLYGHTYAEESGEVSKSDDTPKNGGFTTIQVLINTDKSLTYRACCYHKTNPLMSAEKDEADTKPSGELQTKTYPLSLRIQEDNAGIWRVRKDFTTQADAEAWIGTHMGATIPTEGA